MPDLIEGRGGEKVKKKKEKKERGKQKPTRTENRFLTNFITIS